MKHELNLRSGLLRQDIIVQNVLSENDVSINKDTVLCHSFLHVTMNAGLIVVWFGGWAVKSYIKSENLVCMD